MTTEVKFEKFASGYDWMVYEHGAEDGAEEDKRSF